MFTSIFWLTANENYSIAGSIPSPLLSGSCKEGGYAGIPTRVCSRLTCASYSTRSDYCYALFVHDLVRSISTNNCNMRKYRKYMTLSNNAACVLDLRCNDD